VELKFRGRRLLVSLPVDSEGKSARVLNGNNKEGPQAERELKKKSMKAT